MHHAVSDGWSLRLLAMELEEIYGAFSQGLPSPLPELTIQYADYAVWQRRWLQGEVLAGELAHWRARLAGAPPVLELPLDRPRTVSAGAAGDRGGSRALRLPAAQLAPLQALARGQGATLFMAVLAAFQTLLARVSHAEDVSVGTPVAGRGQLQTENLIGFFVNTLVLRTGLAGEPTFGELLGRVREVALAAYGHQELPFEKLVEELQPRRDLGVSPLFQVSFALDAEAPPVLRLGDLTGSLWPPLAETEKFDLSLTLGLADGRLAGTFGFRAELFDGTTIERLAGQLARLLAAAVAAPDLPVSRLPLLSAAERHQALVEWSGDVRPAPADLLVHEQVERWARETPGAEALVWEEAGAEVALSYAELDRRANLLARRLRALGIGAESRVALGLERSAELVTAALAVLKAGGAYLPLDPEYPAERLRYILADSGAAALLTVRGLAGRFEAPAELPVLLLDEPVPAGAPLAIGLRGTVSAESLAYVIYTSGSTGLPKGTLLRHAGLAGLARWHREAFELRPGERTTLLAGPGFDASVWELWSGLAAGAALCIPPRDTVASPAALAGWLAARQVAVSFLPTPLAEAVLDQGLPAGLALRALLAGGDRLRPRPPAGAGFELYNCYGPTEGTVVATSSRVSPAGPGLPAIGRPISGARVYVVDARAEPVGPGVAGELWLGGAGLARGYLGRPELTAERFVPDPFGAEPGGRLYRTGDLVRRRGDGELEFLDRVDHQVKVRGFRIELGEIEARLAAYPGVREAAVLARPDARGELRLVAWVVAEGGSADRWSAYLGEALPGYMVPSAWGVVEALPLTPNGKVDRRALAALPSPLAVGGWAGDGRGGEPRTPAEELLAGIFASVLGIERVGIGASFFELGGHSLLATQVASRIREAFGAELPLRAVFEAPTVAALAARLTEETRPPGDYLPAIPRASAPERRALSFAQGRLWFLDQLDPGSPMYNLPAAVELTGALDRAAFAAALGEIVRRHEVLRTTFRGEAGEPVAVVSPPSGFALPFVLPFVLPIIDLASLPAVARSAEASRLAGDEARRPFDLAADVLLRVSLLALGETEHVALVTLHHIASDGWSMGVLTRELTALYAAFRAGTPSPLAEPAIQYADYAAWQRRWLQGDRLKVGARFLAGSPVRCAGGPRAADRPAASPRGEPARGEPGAGGGRRHSRPAGRALPAARLDPVHDPALLLRGAPLAPHRPGGPDGGDADRRADPEGDRGADRALRQHPGAARRPRGGARLPGVAGAGAGDGARGLRAPGSAVRASGGGGDAGARPQPSAAGAGAARAPAPADDAGEGADAAGARPAQHPPGDGNREVRADLRVRRKRQRSAGGDRIQPRPVRPLDDRAADRTFRPSARRRGGGPGPGGRGASPAERGGAGAARGVERGDAAGASGGAGRLDPAGAVRGAGTAHAGGDGLDRRRGAAELRGAGGADGGAGAPPAGFGSGARGAGRHLPAAAPGAAGGAPRDARGGRLLRAARSRLSGGAGGLHAGRQRRRRGADHDGAGGPAASRSADRPAR